MEIFFFKLQTKKNNHKFLKNPIKNRIFYERTSKINFENI